MKKAITPVISIIILLLITVSLSGMGWTYMSGYYEAMTAKQIQLVMGSEHGNEVMLQNTGTADIEESDLRILVNGQEAGILNMTPGTIEPKKSARVVFEFSDLGQSSVRIIGPGNTITYSHDIEVDELDSIVSWWRLDGDGKDSVGGNDGIVYGATSSDDAKVGKSLSFEGSENDYVGISEIVYPATQDWTYAMWQKTSGLEWNAFIGKDLSDDGYWMWHYTGKLTAYLESPSPVYFYGVVLGDEAPTGEWFHLAVVSESAGPSSVNLKAYINGQPVETKNDISLPTSEFSLNYIGHGDSRYFTGLIDEVTIWNRALTDNEVNTLFTLS